MSRCGTAFVEPSRPRDARPAFAIDIEVIKSKASDRVRDIAAEFLPNGREVQGYWRTGSIADEPGQSLAVTLGGADKGMWCDHASSGAEGGGNIIQLVAMAGYGGDVGKAIAWLKSFLLLDDMDPARLERERATAAARRESDDAAQAEANEKKRRKALALFLEAGAIAGTPVEHYLRGRGIDLQKLGRAPGACQYHPELYNVEAGRPLPAMVWAVIDVAGQHLATHRTWLAPDGKGGWTKADLEQAKMVLGSFRGGFIPVWKGTHRQSLGQLPAGTDVYVSEGTEDGLTAAMAKPELRVIAAVSLVNIGAIDLPEQAGKMVIIGQRDTNPKTLEALERVIGRQQERGREVWITPPPAGGFKDVNEALQAGFGQSGTLAEGGS